MTLRGYLVVFFVIAIIAAFFFTSPLLRDIFFTVAEDVGSLAGGNIGLAMAVFLALAALSAMFSPFSSAPLIPIAVALWGFWPSAILLMCGWLLGDAISYFIGYYAGHPLLREFISDEKARMYEKRILSRMTFSRALLIRFALPAEVGYAFGLIKYNFPIYMFVTILAEVPFAYATVKASDAFLNVNPMLFTTWIGALVLVIGIAYYFFSKIRGRIS